MRIVQVGFALLWACIGCALGSAVASYLFFYKLGYWFDASVAPAAAYGFVFGGGMATPVRRTLSLFAFGLTAIVFAWLLLGESVHPTKYYLSYMPFTLACCGAVAAIATGMLYRVVRR